MAQIEKLQPYNGCQWTERLRESSNADKHRHLTVVNAKVARLTIKLKLGVDRSAEGPEGVALLLGRQHDMTLGIAFDDGQQVTPTLRHLQAEALQTLEMFKAGFR